MHGERMENCRQFSSERDENILWGAERAPTGEGTVSLGKNFPSLNRFARNDQSEFLVYDSVRITRTPQLLASEDANYLPKIGKHLKSDQKAGRIGVTELNYYTTKQQGCH